MSELVGNPEDSFPVTRLINAEFLQDDAMQDTGSPNDSWAYRSLQSVARPSWMEPDDEEEQVRISVGTFMRGRTEVLGTLEGDGRVPRVRLSIHCDEWTFPSLSFR